MLNIKKKKNSITVTTIFTITTISINKASKNIIKSNNNSRTGKNINKAMVTKTLELHC